MRNEAMSRISENFHAFDHRDCFIHIKVNILMKYKLSVKYKAQILPSIPRA